MPGVRLPEGRGDAGECLPALLPLRRLRSASTTVRWRLLRFLLVRGRELSAEAGRLEVAKRAAFSLEPLLVLGAYRSVVAAGDIPTKGATYAGALADALWRAAALESGWVVYAGHEAHELILRCIKAHSS